MRSVSADPSPDSVLRAYTELVRAGVYGDPSQAMASAEAKRRIFVSVEEVYSGPRSRQVQSRYPLFAHSDLGLVLSATATRAFAEFLERGALNLETQVHVGDLIVRGLFSEALADLSEALGRRHRWVVDTTQNAELAPGREWVVELLRARGISGT